ncbi:hypothetical protein D1AOALGA4SA_7904 [Olavius algarvensis Delta 1 endosymbiont]|nr:hypothetical protein D1AOALGA4SA_7904 [Olavius algarvensis Delta 1 endosymbiont]
MLAVQAIYGFSCQEKTSLESSYETTIKANRRISNIEPQNVEGWNRFAQSF